MRIIIHPDGNIESLENEITQDLGLTCKRRVSRVEPVNPVLQSIFRAIRKRVSDDSKLACWTRTWTCRWQARIFDGPVLGPYDSRQKAIDAEIEFIEQQLLGETT
jgi:hypothetical protein